MPWVLHADLNSMHQPLRRVCASLTNIYSAWQQLLERSKARFMAVNVFDEEIREEGNCQAYLDSKLALLEKIMGLSHRVYRLRIRVKIPVRQMAKDFQTQGPRMRFGISFQWKLKPIWSIPSTLIPNVDFYSATVLHHVLSIDSSITLILPWAGWLDCSYSENSARAINWFVHVLTILVLKVWSIFPLEGDKMANRFCLAVGSFSYYSHQGDGIGVDIWKMPSWSLIRL